MKFNFSRFKVLDSRFLEAVPLANCILLIIVFSLLMWVYSAQGQAGIKVSLPKAVTSETVGAKASAITITREKVLYFGNDPVSAQELVSKLEKMDDKDSVLIKADKGTSLDRVVEVWDICRKAGIRQVNLATTQSK
jgi:biopolymer transport protein ExbD